MLNVKLLTYTKDCEKIVAAAAKLCYSPAGIDDICGSITVGKRADLLILDSGYNLEKVVIRGNFFK